ncbi:TetR family transcriptional regulator [Streptomyces sp. 7G]|uniref:TetR/AcrR family transcriptional regulator n=1 Tax=Streptomyces sp. 7G TaxID=2877241 RepID=UPI001CD73EF0|nr:TetR family transcriptional regulator [Streptomyces sp. 7G]MCA1271047.1 TetR family transcriptional regulator [Streptomyces sp. 7G]
MEFQRARSEEQREQRRAAILTTASEMLTQMPVADISLNELSRRVGLAKSNVLRYFESREAVLLEVLDAQMGGWLTDLDEVSMAVEPDPADERAGQLASMIAATLRARPMLCDLLSAQAGVLERNVSTAVVLRHKRATLAVADEIARIVIRALPELDAEDALHVAAITILTAAASWPHSTPSEALKAAYEADPAIGKLLMSFDHIVTVTLTLTLTGLLAQRQGRGAEA